MSYRTIKRLLGETSLERKCRFLLGGTLMVLITGSFYFYGWQNSSQVREQNERQHKTTARLLAQTAFLEMHFKEFAQNASAEEPLGPIVRSMSRLATKETFGHLELLDYSATLMKPDPKELPPAERPLLDAEDAEDAWDAFTRTPESTEYITIREEVIKIREKEKEKEVEKTFYHFYTPVKGSQACLGCHNRKRDPDQQFKVGGKMGMMKITFPIEQTDKAFAKNASILLATAIVTSFLAMLAAAGIVRYVIVKPVLHLKDVSDEITRGNLDLRADIRTADEFEELSHAFNRMLRYLVTAQEELRDVNSDLDGKVDELAQVNLQLYEMNKLKDEFLATISHELRTPLNSILGFSEVLAGSPNLLSEKQGRYVQNIQTSGKELLSLITDVLDLAKIESGKMELQPVEFALVDLVERQVGSLMPLAEKKNIDLRTEIERDLPTMFQDPGKLQQVLNNLLSNAVKFTPEGGRVRVYAGAAGEEMVELVVDDTGIGIPLEEQASIFEKFRQGKEIPGQSDTLTRRYGGTGLGLSIVKELSKLLGGEVTLESEFGKGSTFSVRLPIRLTAETRQMSDDLLLQRVGVNRAFALDSQPPAASPEAPAADKDSEHDESAA